MRIFAPPHTQTPNELFDEWLPKLSFVELKVLMIIIRKTFGWHKIRDRISISQLEKLTGSNRQAIIRATKGLEKMNLVTKIVVGPKGNQQTFYELIVQENSNNSYQCDSRTTPQCDLDTPPSVMNTLTKETLTKETTTKKREEADAPTPPIFLYKRVNMNQERFQSLVEEFGEDTITTMMDRLDEYADINPKRFKQYACHSTVIRKWIREDKQKSPAGPKNHTDVNKQLARRICEKFKKSDIEAGPEGIIFVNHGAGKDLFISYGEFGFKEQVFVRLRKMNLDVSNL